MGRRIRRYAEFSIAGLALAVTVAACGSSSSTSTTTTAASGSSTTATTSATNSAVAAAQAIVTKYSPRPTSIGITTPVGATIPKGKVIDWVRCSIPSCTNLDNYINTAGALLGWTVKDINEGLTAETVKDAWTQVVANHPDAVATAGFPEVLFSSELAQLKADNIPVVDMSVADPVGNGITAVFDGNSTNDEAGVLQANWAIATEGTKADTFTIGVPTFPTITDVVNSFTKTYKQLCPACPISNTNISATIIGTPQLTTQVVSYLTAHPSVNIIETSDSDVVIGLPSALANAGLHPKIIVLDTSPSVSSYIAKGEVSVTTGVSWDTYMYRAMDTFARIFTHKSIAPDLNATDPQWFITAANIPSTTSYFPVVANYEAQYKKLWGLG